MYEGVRIKQATELIESYRFEEPIIKHIKSFCRANKKLGSRDRKELRELVFDYFRLGLALPEESIKTKIAIAHFLRNGTSCNFVSLVNSVLPNIRLDDFSKNYAGKAKIVQKSFPDFKIDHIFPQSVKLSQGVSREKLSESILTGSITWVRARRAHLEEVEADFKAANLTPVNYAEYPLAFGFEKATDFSEFDSFNKGYFEVQDLSSQHCVKLMNVKDEQSWWDVCSGSGGKALLVFDQVSDVHMTLSDTRKSILKNLEKRFNKADVHPDVIFELDATNKDDMNALNQEFDRIMVDVPCSGSGTWARNPEWLQSADEKTPENYNINQEAILGNALDKLKKGGELYYMTCSVFACENEQIVATATHQKPFKVLTEELIDCTEYKADNLFISVIQRI